MITAGAEIDFRSVFAHVEIFFNNSTALNDLHLSVLVYLNIVLFVDQIRC